jgi:hypothetical protein
LKISFLSLLKNKKLIFFKKVSKKFGDSDLILKFADPKGKHIKVLYILKVINNADVAQLARAADL